MIFYLIKEKITLKSIFVCIVGGVIMILCYSAFLNLYKSNHGFTDTEFTPTDAMLVMDFAFVGQKSDVSFMDEDQFKLYNMC